MSNKTKGFTLIELLIIVGLFAVVVAMAIPQLQSTLSGERLITSRDNLAAELNMARTLSVSRNAIYEFRVDTAAGTYQIIDIEDTGNPPRGLKQLDPGISLGNVPTTPLRFFARGYCTGGSLVLVSIDGNSCTLAVNRSGNVQVGDVNAYETY
jgi:general secretion pathway protein H